MPTAESGSDDTAGRPSSHEDGLGQHEIERARDLERLLVTSDGVDHHSHALDESRVISGVAALARSVRALEYGACKPLRRLHGVHARTIKSADDDALVHLLDGVDNAQSGNHRVVPSADSGRHPIDDVRGNQRARSIVHEDHIDIGW